MDELIKNFNNCVCFTFYENEKKCEITIYNEKEVLCQNIVSEEEGKKNLLTFCLNWRCLEVLPHIDTIGLRNRDEIDGFVRYIDSQGVIRDFKHDLIPKFLCNFLEALQEQSKKIEIDFRPDDCFPFEKEILDMANEQNLITFKVDKKGYFPYIISNYMSKHENVNIREAEPREDSDQIMLDAIQFSIELLNKEQKEYFMSEIRERSNESYIQFLESTFGQKLNQALEEQDSLQLVRTKSVIGEDQ